jgi:hypothetical protein
MALALVPLAPIVVDAAEQESYYLGSDGVPYGELVLNPRGGEMPNYDRGRDVEPGLILERSDRGLAEDDEARFQHWQIEASGERLTGYPSLVVWAAADRFAPARRGVFDVFLLDCNASGGDCEEIGSGQGTIDSGRGAAWVETVVDIGAIDHRFAERRHLAVRIVVSEASESDLIFAYGFTAQRSRLTVYPNPPVSSVETTVPTASTPVDDVAVEAESPADEVQATAQPPMAAVSVGPWLITLVASTIALVALGAVLMSSLTKPGRHERPRGGGHSAAIDRTGPNSLTAR